MGRRTNSPPQFGHAPFSTLSAQSAQKVHSNVHMRASALSGGRSRSQHSQLGRSSSTAGHLVDGFRARFGETGKKLFHSGDRVRLRGFGAA